MGYVCIRGRADDAMRLRSIVFVPSDIASRRPLSPCHPRTWGCLFTHFRTQTCSRSDRRSRRPSEPSAELGRTSGADGTFLGTASGAVFFVLRDAREKVLHDVVVVARVEGPGEPLLGGELVEEPGDGLGLADPVHASPSDPELLEHVPLYEPLEVVGDGGVREVETG